MRTIKKNIIEFAESLDLVFKEGINKKYKIKSEQLRNWFNQIARLCTEFQFNSKNERYQNQPEDFRRLKILENTCKKVIIYSFEHNDLLDIRKMLDCIIALFDMYAFSNSNVTVRKKGLSRQVYYLVQAIAGILQLRKLILQTKKKKNKYKRKENSCMKILSMFPTDIYKVFYQKVHVKEIEKLADFVIKSSHLNSQEAYIYSIFSESSHVSYIGKAVTTRSVKNINSKNNEFGLTPRFCEHKKKVKFQ